MADEPFDPQKFIAEKARLREQQQLRDEAFDPKAFMAQKAKAMRPDYPATSGDPTMDLFVDPAARQAGETPFGPRAAAVAKGSAEGALTSADTNTYGLGNRGMAYGRALGQALPGMGGGGVWENYQKNIDAQNKYLTGLRQANPERTVAADLAGGLVGGAGMTRAGLTLVRPGMGWIARTLAGTGEGILQGTAQGAGQHYGPWKEKPGAILPSAGFGGVVGGAIPLAGSAGRGAKSLFDITRGKIPEFPSSLLRNVEADRTGVANLRQTYGPEGLLADVPALRRSAQAGMSAPGEGPARLESILRVREKGTGPRLRTGTEEILGPNVTTQQLERDIKAAKDAMGPEWDAAFARAKAVDTKGVADWVETQVINRRGPAKAALQEVRNSLNLHGTSELDPHPRTLHETRMAIDGIVNTPGVDPKVAQALGEARDRISAELHAKVPDMANLDAKFAEIAKRKDAMNRGRELFDTGREQYIDPTEWAREKVAMNAPKEGAVSTYAGPSAAPKYSEAGTRAEVDRLVRTSTNDLQTLKGLFAKDAAVQNLTEQFGGKSAEDLQRLIDTNLHFRETFQKLVHGSKTADTLETIADTERGYFNIPKFSATGAMNLVGDALERAQAGYGAGIRNRIAEIMATQGPALPGMQKSLLDASAEQARRDMVRTIVEGGGRTSGIGAGSPRAKPAGVR